MINYINCFDNITKSCITCKHYIPNKLDQDLGLCKLFIKKNGENNLAKYCCSKEVLCGKNRNLYDPKDINNLVWSYHKWINNDNKSLKEELNRIYKNNYNVFENMKKHNILRKNK
jgi:hypothetical protein